MFCLPSSQQCLVPIPGFQQLSISDHSAKAIYLDAYLEHPPRYANMHAKKRQEGVANATNSLSTFAFGSISIISTHQQDALSATSEENIDSNQTSLQSINQFIAFPLKAKAPKRTSLSIHFQYCHQLDGLDGLRRNSGQDVVSLHHCLLLTSSSSESLLLSERDGCRWRSPLADRHIGVGCPNDAILHQISLRKEIDNLPNRDIAQLRQQYSSPIPGLRLFSKFEACAIITQTVKINGPPQAYRERDLNSIRLGRQKLILYLLYHINNDSATFKTCAVLVVAFLIDY
uniref:Uncharacterized protein n=1 Tax=Glossina austeni TaxID=7395 RepID=A0A1A9UJB2_GLOAU